MSDAGEEDWVTDCSSLLVLRRPPYTAPPGHPPGASPLRGKPVEIEGSKYPGLVTGQGLVLTGSDGEKLMVTSVKVGGKSLPAADLLGETAHANGGKEEVPKVDEAVAKAAIEAVWKDILGVGEGEGDKQPTVRRYSLILLGFCPS